MTQRVRSKVGARLRRVALVAVAAVAAGALSVPAFAVPTTAADAGFEGDDGNLAIDGSTFDWNGFATVTWNGSAPERTASKVASGWELTGIEDRQATTADSGFAGGTKQDDDCPKVITAKAPNKDDFKRIYITHKTGTDGHVYLALAWARIPQNTTSSSAHAAFEFNQNDPVDDPTTACGALSGSLVKRSTANGGDMLIVYDFEGGSSPVVLKLLRWKTTGTCEQTGKAATNAGCWVNVPGFTDWAAKVNETTVTDAIAPDGSEDLETQEFGEAIIDLTDAGVFPATPTSCVSFGRAFGVSRSSGNSGTAQMKDLVGPADVNITNCATVIIHKVTVPAGDTTTNFDFTKNFATSPTTSNTFQLKDGDTQSYSGTVFPMQNARVTESDPSGSNYLLTSITCTSASTATNVDRNATTAAVGGVPARTVEFDIAAGQTLECTFTNTRQRVESSMDTSPWYYPNDTATVNAGTGQTNIVGSVQFKLFGATGGATPKTALENCQANGTTAAAGLLYSQSVNLASTTGTSKQASTTNTGTAVSATAQVYWRVEYVPTGDANHHGRLSSCVENINATLTGDTGGTNVPV